MAETKHKPKKTAKKKADRWHPATESPGKRRVLMAFAMKNLKAKQFVFAPVRFMSEHIIPAECEFKDEDGNKKLPVAWKYYDEAIKGIGPKMKKNAELYAWSWWPDDK